MNRVVTTITIGVSVTTVAFAQPYISCVGISYGEGAGVSIRQRIVPGLSLEGNYTTNFAGNHHTSLTGAFHHALGGEVLHYFTGFGVAHSIDNSKHKDELLVTGGNGMSLCGIFGVELTLGRCNFSLHYQPECKLGTVNGLSLTRTEFTIRWVIVKTKSRTKEPIVPKNPVYAMN